MLNGEDYYTEYQATIIVYNIIHILTITTLTSLSNKKKLEMWSQYNHNRVLIIFNDVDVLL